MRLLLNLLRHRTTWRFLLVLAGALGLHWLLSSNSVDWRLSCALYSLVAIRVFLTR